MLYLFLCKTELPALHVTLGWSAFPVQVTHGIPLEQQL